ncbi:hypothetical protein ACXFAU_14385 [Paenibacillus glucanolyticus]
MNATLGTYRLIYEDARWFIGKLLLLYVTLPLTAVWIIIGTFELDNTLATIAAPGYFFFIPFYGIMGFKSILPIAVGLGSTRTQLLRSFYAVGVSTVVMYFVILNVVHLLLMTLYERGISTVSTLHVGLLYSSEYQFFAYLWIDLMFGFLLFGGVFFIYCVMYRLGMTWTLVGVMAIGITAMFLFYSGALDAPIAWLSTLNVNAMTGFTIAGIAGLLALLVTYPMMRNASLQPKAKSE